MTVVFVGDPPGIAIDVERPGGCVMTHAARLLDAWPLATHVADRYDREAASLPRASAPAAQQPAACARLKRPRVDDAARANTRSGHVGERHTFFAQKGVAQGLEALARRGQRRNRLYTLFGVGLFQTPERADDEGGMRNMSGKIHAKERGDRR